MKRILVVTVNWLGDALLLSSIFKALKDNFPSSYIGVMAVERIKEVFSDNPYIDEVIVFDERDKEKSFFAKIKFVNLLKKKRFDTAFLIHRSVTRAFICFLAGIRTRIGYERLKNLFILTKRIEPPSSLIHRQDYYLYLFEKIGIIIKDKSPQFFIPFPKRKKIDNFLTGIKPKHSFMVGIGPWANWELKSWPKRRFALLAERLIEELNCGIFFIGTQKDKEVTEELIKGMQATYNLCGETNLKELGALMQNLDIFISNDSGAAHLASSLGINTLVLFGPTSALITSPQGKVRIIKKDIDCKIPCYNLTCKDNICMKKISVEEVFQEAKNLLGKSQK